MNVFQQCFKVKSCRSFEVVSEAEDLCEEVDGLNVQAFAFLFGENTPSQHISTVQDIVDTFSIFPTIKEYSENEIMAPLSARIKIDEVLVTKYPTIPLNISCDIDRSPDEDRDVLRACVECTQKYTWECTKQQPQQFLLEDKIWKCPICHGRTRKLERSHVGKSRISIIRDVLKAFPRERNISRLIFLSLLLNCRHEIVICCGKCSTSLENIDSLSYYDPT